jgi:preprotein translocase YajC subunit
VLAPFAASPLVLSAAAAATKSKGSSTTSLLLIIGIVVLIVYALINGRRRAKTAQQSPAQIDVGSEIVTRGGLIATLVARTDDYVVLQLEDGTRARYLPQAVLRLWEAPSSSTLDAEAEELDPDREPPTGSGPLAD